MAGQSEEDDLLDDPAIGGAEYLAIVIARLVIADHDGDLPRALGELQTIGWLWEWIDNSLSDAALARLGSGQGRIETKAERARRLQKNSDAARYKRLVAERKSLGAGLVPAEGKDDDQQDDCGSAPPVGAGGRKNGIAGRRVGRGAKAHCAGRPSRPAGECAPHDSTHGVKRTAPGAG